MAEKSAAPRRYIHFMSCRARNGFAPRRCATNASSGARGSPNRFTRSPATLTSPRAELNFAEEIADFARRRVRSVRAMHDVFVDAVGEIGANRSLGRFFWVSGSHDFAIPCNGTFTFEHLHHHRAGGHEADQVLEEWPLAMHGVKALRFGLRQLQHSRRHHSQAR